jgi:CRISPR-associated endonuclease/helicase Cas3
MSMEAESNTTQPVDTSRPLYAAHSPNEVGRWQPMDEHETKVGELGERFAAAFGAGALGRLCGLLHDAGKYHDDFQTYLDECVAAKAAGGRGPNRGPDHKSAGALWIQELNEGLAEFLKPIIAGHHGGLPSQADLENLEQQREFHTPSVERARAALGDLELPDLERVPAMARLQTEHQSELFVRFLYSCLVDADSLDTERHFNEAKTVQREGAPDISVLLPHYYQHQQGMMERVRREPLTPVNEVRMKVYEACLNAALLPPGIFRLTVPTGGGKTLSSLGFALEHAQANNLHRIIYALPFTAIVDQTADVFRRVFPTERAVLEHHSAIQEPEDAEGGQRDEDIWRRLATDNWDATVIVTTTVQLFDSLFSNRRGRCRKLHRLVKSVIVLDEVQTLPLELLQPILDVLAELVDGYGVSVVLCTATPPALDVSSPYLTGLQNVEDIITNPQTHYRALQRVKYDVCGDAWSWERVASEMWARRQCLTVVNTRRDALALWEALADPNAIHLSTLMCGAHRRRALAEIRARLKSGLPCRVVSTQLIEAGVDISFPAVFRAIGPFDRIIQAAGRCNRHGELLGLGEVVVFFPSEGGAPQGIYRMAMDEARDLLAQGDIDFDDPNTYTSYFQRVVQLLGASTDRYKIQSLRTAWNFPEVAKEFRLIRDDTMPVLVDYDPYFFRRIQTASKERRLTDEEWQQVQQHVVGIRWHDFQQLKRSTIEEWVRDQLYAWEGQYDPWIGLSGVDRDPLDLIG